MNKVLLILIASQYFIEARAMDFPSFTRGNISILKKITGDDFDPNLPKKAKFIPVDEVVHASDVFLKKAFGEEFSAPIRKITIDRYMGEGGEFVWCWVVCYFDPENLEDVKSAKLFYVYLDLTGKPMMEIKSK